MISSQKSHSTLRKKRTTHLHRGHNSFDTFIAQFQHTVQYADLVVTKRLGTRTMKLQKRTQLGLLVRMRFIRTEDAVEQLGDRVRDGRCGEEEVMVKLESESNAERFYRRDTSSLTRMGHT
jgi:hypothetical protein